MGLGLWGQGYEVRARVRVRVRVMGVMASDNYILVKDIQTQSHRRNKIHLLE